MKNEPARCQKCNALYSIPYFQNYPINPLCYACRLKHEDYPTYNTLCYMCSHPLSTFLKGKYCASCTLLLAELEEHNNARMTAMRVKSLELHNALSAKAKTDNVVKELPKKMKTSELLAAFQRGLVGQPGAVEAILPFVHMHEAGLSPGGRPLGVVLLLGPTGVGKTLTVEVLAEVLHGTRKKLLKVNCGEYQQSHEMAKLVGSPPGYLGHRETQPVLSQSRIAGCASDKSDISLIVFDEIEKAHDGMARMLLGILDKATLQLGDNTVVNFEKCLIFLTSNLGARAIASTTMPIFGLERAVGGRSLAEKEVTKIGLAAVKKHFSPEFVNRIDAVLTYSTLDGAALGAILDLELAALYAHINDRLGLKGFDLEVTGEAREWLIREGTSKEFGARELKRAIQRYVTQPLAVLVMDGKVAPASEVVVHLSAEGGLGFRVKEHGGLVVVTGKVA